MPQLAIVKGSLLVRMVVAVATAPHPAGPMIFQVRSLKEWRGSRGFGLNIERCRPVLAWTVSVSTALFRAVNPIPIAADTLRASLPEMS